MKKYRINKYTAFVPKTIKATKKLSRNTLGKIKFFLLNTKKTLKNTGKMLNSATSKSIRSLTKKRKH